MTLDSLPQINLGTAVLVIFVLCAAFVLLRGMVRMLIGTVVVGCSLGLAWLVWKNAPVWLFETTGNAPDWAAPALAGTTFLASWFLLGKVIRFFVRPGDTSAGRPSSLAGTLVRLVFSLVPTSLLAMVAAVFFHHEETQPASGNNVARPTTDPQSAPLMTRLSDWLGSTIPRDWLEALDPVAAHDRVELAKAITAQAQTPRAPAIDPQTGKPIPRAIIVQDPELQTLAREGKFSALLRHPSLTKALADPKIQKVLHDLKP